MLFKNKAPPFEKAKLLSNLEYLTVKFSTFSIYKDPPLIDLYRLD